MKIFRQKLFVGLEDGFGGKLGRIKRIGIRRSDSYKPYGPWIVNYSDNAQNELEDIEYFSREDLIKIQSIVNEIRTKPYQGKFDQHPLWEFVDLDHNSVVWSAKINEKDRLVYLIFTGEDKILILNLKGHTVTNLGYSLSSKKK